MGSSESPATAVATRPFIKASEVWAPAPDGHELQLVSGSYGDLHEFRAASERHRFGFDRGLPGTAWAARRPLLMRTNSETFERREAAAEAGITVAIALPTFAGEFLTGVVVFLCGDDADNVGAIEIWHCDTTRSYDMALLDGYFGRLEHFEFVARHTSFRQGVGLPGIVWETGRPAVFHDLGRSHKFVRATGAGEAGITTGLGLPASTDPAQPHVLAFLSALGTPIARQIEIWNCDGDELVFDDGYHEAGTDLTTRHAGVRIGPRNGPLGAALFRGMPVVSTEVGPAGDELGCTSLVAIPMLDDARCTSVVAISY